MISTRVHALSLFHGHRPVELARILKKGIEDEQLFILPFPDPERCEDGLEGLFRYTTPKVRKTGRVDGAKNGRFSKNPAKNLKGAAESGWGKARKTSPGLKTGINCFVGMPRRQPDIVTDEVICSTVFLMSRVLTIIAYGSIFRYGNA